MSEGARRLSVAVPAGPPSPTLERVLAAVAARGHDAVVGGADGASRAPDARVVVAAAADDLAALASGPPALVVVTPELAAPALRSGAAALARVDATPGEVERALDALLAPIERRVLEGGNEELLFLGSLVQSVVHDLRNPLQAALFGLSTLRAVQAGKAAEPLAMLERKVREIEGILAELHESAQPWRPVVLPFPLGELLEGARTALAEAARERQVELRVEPAATPIEVQVDPPRLKKALMNLVRIAVEASVPGAVVVLSAGLGPDGRGWVEVVDDRQAPPEGADFAAGAGRGSRRRLAIARRTIEAHGGVLEVEPRSPRGARARVVLPATCVVPVG